MNWKMVQLGKPYVAAIDGIVSESNCVSSRGSGSGSVHHDAADWAVSHDAAAGSVPQCRCPESAPYHKTSANPKWEEEQASPSPPTSA